MLISALGRSMRLYNHKVGDQLKRMVFRRSEDAFAVGDARRDAIRSVADLDVYRRKLREDLIAALGGLPPRAAAPEARIAGVVKDEGFRIEKLSFQSRPGVVVTANLYIPHDVDSPRGTVLFLCGHGKEAKLYPAYQTACRYLVKSGLVVMAQDPVGQGERFSYFEKSTGDTTVPWGTMEHEYAGCQSLLLGDSIARYFLHDAIRGIDYLCTRPEVDAERIGVTGNSGGGVQSSLLMMCDPRIAAAAPATFLTNRREYLYMGETQDAEQIWPGFSALGYDHEDILLSMAPRPVRVLAVQWDFFPIEGTRTTVSRCARFWEIYGKGGLLDLVEDASTHRYTPFLAKAAAEFFTRHLLGHTAVPDDAGVAPFAAAVLTCTRSGQVRGDIPDARFVHEENCLRLDGIEASRRSLPPNEHREEALEWLRRKTFEGRRTCALNPRFYNAENVEGFAAEMSFWWSQERVFGHACLFRRLEDIGKAIPVTLALWDGGTRCIASHRDTLEESCSRGRGVMVLDTTGVGMLEPDCAKDHGLSNENMELHKLMDDLVWLDDSIILVRTYDVLRALDMIGVWPAIDAGDTEILACGVHGIYGQLAAVLDGRVKDIRIEGCIRSFAQIVRSRHYDFDFRDIMDKILPGVLRHFDLPDVERWIRERKR